jgi:spore coat protein H
MKYRVLGLVMTAVMVLAMAAFSFYSPENGERRIHQHLTSRGPDQGCDCDGSQLCTHLPLVILDTGGVDVPGEPLSSDGTLLKPEDHEYEYTQVTLAEDGSKTIACQVSVVDHTDSNNHPGDEPTLQSAAQIRIRGNTSRLHDKKGYLLSLTTDDGESNRDAQMLGMDPHHEWALHGPYLDKTLIRNYMWYNIAGEIMDYAPNVRFCEVILNGEYLGLYLMTETITNGEDSRLKMTMPQDGSDAVSYVVRLDRGSSTPMKNIETFTQYALRTYNVLDIAYPGAGNLTPERIEYIRQDFSDFEKVLYSYDYNTEPYAWWNLADMDSFADYFLLHEFTCNYDVGSRSTYMYKDLRGTYKMCIWDFNSACDNFYESQLKPQRFQLQNITWFYMILKDENFVNHTIERYRELRTSYLSEDYLNTYIDETIAYLGPAIDRNFSVWGYTFEDYRPLTPDSRNPDDYLEAVDQLKDFCRDRGYWMDENIDKLLQFCHPSKNKKFNH